MLRCLVAVVLVGQLLVSAHASADAEVRKLLGRSSVDGYRLQLDESDWQWLREKRTLRLGTAEPSYPPFDITSGSGEYEGLTADYAQLIAQLLHVNVEVHPFKSRSDVVQALKDGTIDFLGTANGYEAADPGLVLSRSYADDQPVFVTQSGQVKPLDPDMAGKVVVMVYHYLPPDKVHEVYPKAQLKLFHSALGAIGAVAFGQADVYLGDSISAKYIINKSYLNNVQLADFSRMESSNFSFAFTRSSRLVGMVNAALNAIPVSEHMTILQRWNAGGVSLAGDHRFQFSATEQRWIEKHPRVKLTIQDGFLPMTFFDEGGVFRGVSADVLKKVSLRTGLQFDVQRSGSVEDMIHQVKTGDAQMIAALTPSQMRESDLRFTRPYLITPFVLVTSANTGSPTTLDEMSGKRLALIRGNANRAFLIEHYPTIQLVEASDAAQAMAMVADGEADGAVNLLISARYMIARDYRDRLRISSTVGTTSAQIAFAIDRGSLELFSILDKALLSISPQDMDEVTNQWRTETVVRDGYWIRHRSNIIQGFIGAAVLLVLATVWITFLRRQVRRRKTAERALNDQIEFMRVLIDGTPHPIYVRDREGRLMSCNAGYLELFGVDREDIIGKKIIAMTLANANESGAYHDDYLRVMDEDKPLLKDRTLTLRSGKVLTIYHWMLPYQGSDGTVIGMIGGWIDVSERYQLIEELQVAKIIADDANTAKTTFLATMSHEIRTPMNAIIGMLELAMKKAEKGELDRFAIEVASGAAHGLLDLIGDILDIARIESGRLSLAPERGNLRELVESVVRVFDGLARQKQLQLLLDIDFATNRDVLIDPLRFKQILSNLLSNAIKFTAEGEVRLIVQSTSIAGDERLAIRLKVEDSGSGISPDDQERLFSPFAQAANHGQSARSGSGLGLVISRTLCEMMGGTLQLKSVLGKGTQIEVALDLPTLPPIVGTQEAELAAPSTIAPLNVLVVDDYPANRQLLTQQLTYLGHHVTDAEDGAQGLHAWRDGNFDVVITDCNMPVMNGYELARAIREAEQVNNVSRCLLLGFTANAQEEEKTRCMAAGMDDCLFKPTSLQDLAASLNSAASARQLEKPEGDSVQSPPIVDVTTLEQLARGDKAAIQRLVDALAMSVDQDLLRLNTLFAELDLTGLADLAHRVKGGARIVKGHALMLACEHLEKACEPDQSGVSLTIRVQEMEQAMKEFALALPSES